MFYVDNTCSKDLLDLNDYGPKKGVFRNFLVVKDIYSKFGETVPSKSKTSQTVKDSFENIFISSDGKQKLIQGDDGKEFV